MFEVIISNVNTGRVLRKIFDTRTEADEHVERFLDAPFSLRPRNRRHYRVEVCYRPEPELRPLPVPVRAADAGVASVPAA